MWQILNGDAWMQPMVAGENGYTFTAGSWQNSTTSLTPFFQTDGSFWTSDTARNWEIFGYTYTDADLSRIELPQLQSNLRRSINQWWGPSRPNGITARYEHVPASTEDGNYTEWIVNVMVNVNALNGSFTVPFFIGEVPEDTLEWHSAPCYVGSVAVLGMNSKDSLQTKSSTTMPLTSALLKMVKAGHIRSLEPEVVEPLLRKSLQFRILDSNLEGISAANVNGLYVGLTSSEVEAPKRDDLLAQWGDSVKRFELHV